MKRLAIVVVAMFVALPVRADDFVVGAGLGPHGMTKGMLGDTPEIADGLGLRNSGRQTVRAVPHLTFGIDGLGDARRWAVETDLAWYADSLATQSVGGIAMSVRRDVVPVSLLFRATSHVDRKSHFVFAFGPTLAISHFSESGWFGEQETTAIGYGGTLWLGGRSQLAESASVLYQLFVQVVNLPRHSALMRDGGPTVIMGPTLTLEFGR